MLGLARGGVVEIVTVDADAARADKLARRGGKIFETHGVETAFRGIHSSGHPATVLLELAQDAAMLVMGAFGRRELRDYFLGSCTRRMLADGPAPLFVHH